MTGVQTCALPIFRDESNKDTERPKSSESKMDESEKGRGLSEKENVGKRERERERHYGNDD